MRDSRNLSFTFPCTCRRYHCETATEDIWARHGGMARRKSCATTEDSEKFSTVSMQRNCNRGREGGNTMGHCCRRPRLCSSCQSGAADRGVARKSKSRNGAATPRLLLPNTRSVCFVIGLRTEMKRIFRLRGSWLIFFIRDDCQGGNSLMEPAVSRVSNL